MYVPCIYIVYYRNIQIISHVCPEYIHGIYLRYTIHMNCIYDVYTKDKQCSIYNEYAWYITVISHPDWYMHGIYKIYTWYIKGIWCSQWPVYTLWNKNGFVPYLFYNDIPVIYHEYLWINMIYHRYIIIKKGMEQTHFYFTRYIPAIWMRTPYAFDIPYIPCIYHAYTSQDVIYQL